MRESSFIRNGWKRKKYTLVDNKLQERTVINYMKTNYKSFNAVILGLHQT